MAAPEPARPSGRRRLIGLLAGLLILVFLGLALVSGWGAVTDYRWRVRPLAAIAGFVALFFVYVLNALGYVLILEQLAGRRVDRPRFVAIWGRSLLGRYVPGNVLMVASRLVLGQEAGVARKVSLAGSVYEQALNVGAAAAGGLLLLAAYGSSTVGPAAWLVAVVPLGLLLLHPRAFGTISRRVLTRLGREPLEVLLSVRQLLALFAWYLSAAALLAVGVWLLVRSAAGPEAGSPAYVGLSFLTSFVVSMLAFVFPSGLGIREGAFALALSRNLPGEVAIAISAGIRLVLTLAELLFVALATLVDRRGRR
ncbi:MAG: glycosyltransferase 2 family protein [Solirubrobacteraceae bacterium]|nr:glycosyltransferase 2 family protein [Solirubrobacteraceae bacterium]